MFRYTNLYWVGFDVLLCLETFRNIDLPAKGQYCIQLWARSGTNKDMRATPLQWTVTRPSSTSKLQHNIRQASIDSQNKSFYTKTWIIRRQEEIVDLYTAVNLQMFFPFPRTQSVYGMPSWELVLVLLHSPTPDVAVPFRQMKRVGKVKYRLQDVQQTGNVNAAAIAVFQNRFFSSCIFHVHTALTDVRTSLEPRMVAIQKFPQEKKPLPSDDLRIASHQPLTMSTSSLLQYVNSKGAKGVLEFLDPATPSMPSASKGAGVGAVDAETLPPKHRSLYTTRASQQQNDSCVPTSLSSPAGVIASVTANISTKISISASEQLSGDCAVTASTIEECGCYVQSGSSGNCLVEGAALKQQETYVREDSSAVRVVEETKVTQQEVLVSITAERRQTCGDHAVESSLPMASSELDDPTASSSVYSPCSPRRSEEFGTEEATEDGTSMKEPPDWHESLQGSQQSSRRVLSGRLSAPSKF